MLNIATTRTREVQPNDLLLHDERVWKVTSVEKTGYNVRIAMVVDPIETDRSDRIVVKETTLLDREDPPTPEYLADLRQRRAELLGYPAYLRARRLDRNEPGVDKFIRLLLGECQGTVPLWFTNSIATVNDNMAMMSWAMKPEFVDSQKRRSWGRPTVFLQRVNKLFGPIFTKTEIERIAYSIGNAVPKDNKVTFRIVEGEEIVRVYDTGPHSCASGKSYTALYANNSDVVRMLVIEQEDKVIGRALLWSAMDEQGEVCTVLDRIYPNDGVHVGQATEYARTRGWDYLTRQSYQQPFASGKKYTVTLRDPSSIYRTGVPYMDSFYLTTDLMAKTLTLTNWLPMGAQCFQLNHAGGTHYYEATHRMGRTPFPGHGLALRAVAEGRYTQQEMYDITRSSRFHPEQNISASRRSLSLEWSTMPARRADAVDDDDDEDDDEDDDD